MSKTKGIQIGEGFILSEENGYYKVSSVSKNFSMRVNNTLPFWGACDRAMKDVEFREKFHDMIVFIYAPAAIQINQDVYNKYNAFLGELTKSIEGTPVTDKEHDEALNQVKEEWGMKKESKESEISDKQIYYRPHRGGFAESDAERFVVKSLQEIKDYYDKQELAAYGFRPTELKCEFYCNDNRNHIWYDTYMITGMIDNQRIPLGFSSGMLK